MRKFKSKPTSNASKPNELLPKITKIIYTHPNGRSEIHYEFPFGSQDAKNATEEIDAMNIMNGGKTRYIILHF